MRLMFIILNTFQINKSTFHFIHHFLSGGLLGTPVPPCILYLMTQPSGLGFKTQCRHNFRPIIARVDQICIIVNQFAIEIQQITFFYNKLPLTYYCGYRGVAYAYARYFLECPYMNNRNSHRVANLCLDPLPYTLIFKLL